MLGALSEGCPNTASSQLRVVCLIAPQGSQPLLKLCLVLHTEVKETQTVGPVLIHVITDKGRGYDPSLKAADRMHGVTKFDPRTGTQVKGKSTVSAAARDGGP